MTQHLFVPELRINIKKLKPNAVIPTYAHGPQEDAGMDLHAIAPATLRPFVPALVNTGLSIELPPGYEAQIRPRSGLALKNGLMVVNSPGTIDPSYRGEIGVILMWTGAYTAPVDTAGNPVKVLDGSARLMINEGDRIAQMVIGRYSSVTWVETEELSDTERGDGGFGSSGVRRTT